MTRLPALRASFVATFLAAFVGAFLLAPELAHACPSCATRDGLGVGAFALIAGLVAVPYGVAAVVVKVVRRIDADAHGEAPSGTKREAAP